VCLIWFSFHSLINSEQYCCFIILFAFPHFTLLCAFWLVLFWVFSFELKIWRDRLCHSSGKRSVWTFWYEVKVWWSNIGKVSHFICKLELVISTAAVLHKVKTILIQIVVYCLNSVYVTEWVAHMWNDICKCRSDEMEIIMADLDRANEVSSLLFVYLCTVFRRILPRLLPFYSHYAEQPALPVMNWRILLQPGFTAYSLVIGN